MAGRSLRSITSLCILSDNFFPINKYFFKCRPFSANTAPVRDETDIPDDEFRVLDLKRTQQARGVRRREVSVVKNKPRAESMPVDQDWTNVWPGPRSFHPASVPLPLRQGVNKLGPPPAKYGNAELMKIPNFLHLTPPAIQKHCRALKQFCTEWPRGLETDQDCAKHFPLEVIESDYCHSSSSIRDPLSRIVTIKLPLSRLQLDGHAKDKFLRLVGDRYDESTDTLTIVTDKCPLKQQNYEYALYLLTAVYHESWMYEDWEKEKTEADMEYYDWDNSTSRTNVEYLAKAANTEMSQLAPLVDEYKEAVIGVFDEGENDYTWQKYREASEKLLFHKT